MRFCFSLQLQTVSLAAFALAGVAAAQTATVSTSARPAVRITAKVDNSVTRQIPGTHPMFHGNAVVGARLSASKMLPHLKLVLTSSADQEAALQQLMGEQQDKTSANYHKWLTPETFGTYFGPAQADIAKVTAWLGDQGMSVEAVSKSGRVVTFTGSVGHVESAFHTQINAVQIDGVAHISNTTDVSIPEALAPVVAGVARINDIFPTHAPGKVSTVKLQAAADGTASGDPVVTPYFGAATGTHYITPGDLAVIDNTTPLISSGVDGTGQTVSILAQSNIDLADVEEFRSIFGLKKNDPTIIVVGNDPGENQDDTEAFLDAEWGGAMAPGAALNFIVSSPDLENGGVDASALYTVDNNLGDIISLSYGGGELNNGASGTAFFNTLWEQAAAQGQTVFVSSGDSGAATCDSSSNAYATAGYCVNALGSSAFNVAVGGSIFVDWNQALYWGATGGTNIPFANALSYIPEGALNQGRLTSVYPDYLNSASSAYTTGSGIFSDGGGISIYTARPSWQTGSGIPTNADAINVYSGTGIASGSPITGLHRLVPDLVNISANGHDGTLFCASSLCSVTSAGGLNNAGIVGGTSVAAPTQAGIQALINQKNGGRQGNVLPILYSLANTQYTASTTACQATVGTTITSTPTLPASTCNFQDIIAGSNIVPTASTGTAGIGFASGVGFDEATGLGSMNVNNVATNWSTVSMVATATTFTLSPTAGITHGAAQNLKVTVTPTSGTGTPTGDISLIASTTTPNGPRTYTLSSGAFSGLVSSSTNVGTGSSSALPAGSYNVYVHYAGDGTYAPSNSASVPVSISKEGSSTSVSSYNVTTAGAVNQQTTFAYGADVYLDTFVTGTSSSGFPTGTVTYAISRYGFGSGTVTGTLDATGNTYFLAGQSFPGFYLKPNSGVLGPGAYVVTATYSGDPTFTASNTTQSFTVTQLTPAVTFTAPSNISSGATAVFGYSIANPSTTANPDATVVATGTVSFVDTTTSTVLGSCTLGSALIPGSNLPSAVCSFSTTGITAAGANNISAIYGGDTNYAANTAVGTVTVGTLTASTLALTSSGTATVGGIVTLKATMSPATATGSVSFFDGTTFLGTGTLASGIATLALGSTTTGYGTLAAATHSLSATYTGSTTYASSTGTLSLVVAQNTTVLTLSAPSSSTYGQPVVFSVSLTRSPSTGTANAPAIQPTGLVSFYNSTVSTTTPVATGTLSYDPAGYGYYAAAGATTALPAGSNTITATYVGDANFKTSTATLTPVVTVAQLTPTITLTSSATVYNGTSSVALTATIPLSSALAAPTGVVTFYDSTTTNTTLGTATATYSATAGGYVATYTATSQSSGAHNYKAVLTGDTNYVAATSNTISVLLTTNNVWVANGNGTVSAITEGGSAVTPAGVSNGGTGIAIDNTGDVWSASKAKNLVSEYSSTGSLLNSYSTAGITAPSALAIDGSGLVWIANGTGTVSVLSSTGTPVSPSAGYKVSASTPTSIEIDASGNVWLTNSGDNSVSEVIGAATPVTTPTINAVKTNTLAAKP